jgi:hypothetical protein
MWNPTPRRASRLGLLGLALLAAGLLPSSARAQERIQSIRLGRHPGYQRIVLEVASGVDAYTTGEPKRIEIDAEPPSLAPQMSEQLSALGVRLERSGKKTQVVLEPGAARPWVAFRLKQGAPRIVVDLGPGAPALPDAAETLREIAAPPPPSVASVTMPEVSADPPVAPPRDPEAKTNRAAVRVRVQGLELVGLEANGPTREEILALGLSVIRGSSGDWEAANGAPGAKRVSLRELTSSAADAPALMGSVLQHVVERIAAMYAERGLIGTRIDIRQSDLDSLLERAGPLVVHIRPYRAPIR